MSAGAWLLLVGLATGALACGEWKELRVTATAYNATPRQTDARPFEGAWGDDLRGRRAIAVSRDLLELGLVRGTRVRVEGLFGTWVVLDRMAGRWTRRIDVYMGRDVETARAFGVREVTIRYRVED